MADTKTLPLSGEQAQAIAEKYFVSYELVQLIARAALAAQAQAEPVAWKHDCAALLTNDVELWIDRCPHCGKPRPQPAPQPVAQAEAVAVRGIGDDMGAAC